MSNCTFHLSLGDWLLQSIFTMIMKSMLVLIFIISIICKTLYCLDDSKTIFVNDDYCDNGDDEPNTAACSGLLRNSLLPTFTCLDQEYYIEKIFSSRVNDGICDCCDGSDELSNINMIGSCVNICKEIGEIKLYEQQSKNLNRIKGLEKKERIKVIVDNKLRSLKDQYDKGQINLPRYKEILKSYRSEIIKKDKKDLKKQEYLLDEAKLEIHNTFNNLRISKEKIIHLIGLLALRGGEESVEIILNKIIGNFINPNDEQFIDDTEALYLAMNYQKIISKTINNDGSISSSSSSLSDSNDLIQMVSSLALNYVKPEILLTILPEIAVYALKSGQLLKSFNDLNIKLNILSSKLIEIDNFFSVSFDINQLNQKIKELESDINNLSHMIKDYDRMKQKDFGPDKILYEFWNKCYNYNSTDYSYSICPFQDVKQNGNTILGRYTKFILEKGSDHIPSLSLLFTQGDRCMSIPSRRPRVLQLYIECSSLDGHNIIDISEVETCKYIATMKSVIGCW